MPAQLRFQHRAYRTTVEGIEPRGELTQLLTADLDVIDLPPHGVVLTDYLAELLHVSVGDMLTIEVLEGSRPTVEVPVVGTAKQYMGVSAYMQRASLNRLLDEGSAIQGSDIAGEVIVLRLERTAIESQVLENIYVS